MCVYVSNYAVELVKCAASAGDRWSDELEFHIYIYRVVCLAIATKLSRSKCQRCHRH